MGAGLLPSLDGAPSFPTADAELGGNTTLPIEWFSAQSPRGSPQRWLSSSTHPEPYCALNQVFRSEVCGQRAGAVWDQDSKGQASREGGT